MVVAVFDYVCRLDLIDRDQDCGTALSSESASCGNNSPMPLSNLIVVSDPFSSSNVTMNSYVSGVSPRLFWRLRQIN